MQKILFYLQQNKNAGYKNSLKSYTDGVSQKLISLTLNELSHEEAKNNTALWFNFLYVKTQKTYKHITKNVKTYRKGIDSYDQNNKNIK